MNQPEIGDTITTAKALELCRHFSLDYLIDRIKSNPKKYQDWKFDGCSGLPDEVMGFFTGCDWKDITYKCCLPHDLCYAYGDPGNDIERKRLRIHTQETFEGRLFLDFLALIIYSRISSVMRKEGINKDLTVQELMYELKKIKLIRLGVRKTIITEVSKKQRELFQSFKIVPPTRT